MACFAVVAAAMTKLRPMAAMPKTGFRRNAQVRAAIVVR